ncbi:Uncharacterised protein [uncultured archaeon]|nr:Uncharacterised protein [uncultured archaeon]
MGSIDDQICSICDPVKSKLHDFLSSCESLRIPSYSALDKSTANVIIQGEGKYHFDASNISSLFEVLEECRQKNVALHFCEKQTCIDYVKSGMMIDLDMLANEPLTFNIIEKSSTQINNMIRIIGEEIANVVQLTDGDVIHVGVIAKPASIPKDGKHKYGIHFLIPSCRIDVSTKKYILNKLCSNSSFINELEPFNLSSNQTIDLQSACVPVMFLGSCKLSSSISYLPAILYKMTADKNKTRKMTMPEKVDDLDKYNLVGELSLVYEMKYEEDKPPLIRKKDYEIKPEKANEVKDFDLKTNSVGSVDVINQIEMVINEIANTDENFAEVKDLLNILPTKYSEDYHLWRDIIFALSSMPSYQPLAHWFSMKCSSKYNSEAVDKLWTEGMSYNRLDRLTLKTIHYYARTEDPMKYNEVINNRIESYILREVRKSYGVLTHELLSRVLYKFYKTKLVCSSNPLAKKKEKELWCEFILPSDIVEDNEHIGEDENKYLIWKWKCDTNEPLILHKAISGKLKMILDSAVHKLEEQYLKMKTNSETPKDYIKVFKSFIGNFKKNIINLQQMPFRKNIINACEITFRNDNLYNSMDRDENFMGVGNGVLQLGEKCSLITGCHRNLISHYTKVNYIPFNPNDKITRQLLDIISQTIPEVDAREWMMFFYASTLRGGSKPELCLFKGGQGQNGKSTISRFTAGALGGETEPKSYASKFNISLLTEKAEASDKPNSALATCNKRRFIYAEETNKRERLNTAQLKKMVNATPISVRGLYADQVNMPITWLLEISSQHQLTINATDNGTWRRIRYYGYKMKFCNNPDPKNPYEKLENPDIIGKMANDTEYLSRYLSILVHFYERLQNEYSGQLKDVISETIMTETEEYRYKQDQLHKFISTSVIVSPTNAISYSMPKVIESYSNWLEKITGHRNHEGITDEEIHNSVLKKYITTIDGQPMLCGCRIAENPSDFENHVVKLNAGERLVSQTLLPERKNVNSQYPDDWWNGRSNNQFRNAQQKQQIDMKLVMNPIDNEIGMTIEERRAIEKLYSDKKLDKQKEEVLKSVGIL